MTDQIIDLNGGEFSPHLDVRVDITRGGCRTCQNFIPQIWGNVERRPGTKYIYSSERPPVDDY